MHTWYTHPGRMRQNTLFSSLFHAHGTHPGQMHLLELPPPDDLVVKGYTCIHGIHTRTDAPKHSIFEPFLRTFDKILSMFKTSSHYFSSPCLLGNFNAHDLAVRGYTYIHGIHTRTDAPKHHITPRHSGHTAPSPATQHAASASSPYSVGHHLTAVLSGRSAKGRSQSSP